jgi:hypothetical protein
MRPEVAYLKRLHRPAGEGNVQELDLGRRLTSTRGDGDPSRRKGTDKKKAVRTSLEAHLLGRPAASDRGHLRCHPERILAKEAKERQGGPRRKNEKKNEHPPADFDLHDGPLLVITAPAPTANGLPLFG